jgi:hypothetical protein
MNYILIEDTEVMNSGYSILLDLLFSKRITGCKLIYWRSPGWETNVNLFPILSTRPTYLYTTPSVFEECSNFFYAPSPDFIQRSHSVTKSLLSLCTIGQSVSFRKLLQVTLDDIPVGRSLVSTFLRLYPATNIEHCLPYDIVFRTFLPFISSILYFQLSGFAKKVTFAFFSESVYLSLAFVHLFLSYGASCPFLYSSDSPIWCNQNHLHDSHGVSPRLTAFRSTSFIFSTAPQEEYWRARINSHIQVNKSTQDQVKRSLSLASDLSTKSHIPYITNSEALRSISYSQNTLQLVFFLHAITDGPFLHGFSGYITPYDFYQSLIEEISLVLDGLQFDILVNLRMHPNLFHGASSSYQSHRSRSDSEEAITSALVVSLVTLCRNKGINCILSSSDIDLRTLLALPQVAIVSHHGSVCLEANLFSSPVLTSSVSPLNCYPLDPDICIFHPNISPAEIISFLQSASRPKIKLFNKDHLRHANRSNRYISHHSSLVSAINSTLSISDSSGFDQLVYRNSYSWRSASLFIEFPKLELAFSDYLAFCYDSMSATNMS